MSGITMDILEFEGEPPRTAWMFFYPCEHTTFELRYGKENDNAVPYYLHCPECGATSYPLEKTDS